MPPITLLINRRTITIPTLLQVDTNYQTTTAIYSWKARIRKIWCETFEKLEFPKLPVQGPDCVNDVVPLFDIKNKGTDAMFALACNYQKN